MEIDIERLDNLGYWRDQGIVSGITHWMELPEPPEDDKSCDCTCECRIL